MWYIKSNSMQCDTMLENTMDERQCNAMCGIKVYGIECTL